MPDTIVPLSSAWRCRPPTPAWRSGAGPAPGTGLAPSPRGSLGANGLQLPQLQLRQTLRQLPRSQQPLVELRERQTSGCSNHGVFVHEIIIPRDDAAVNQQPPSILRPASERRTSPAPESPAPEPTPSTTSMSDAAPVGVAAPAVSQPLLPKKLPWQLPPATPGRQLSARLLRQTSPLGNLRGMPGGRPLPHASTPARLTAANAPPSRAGRCDQPQAANCSSQSGQ